MALNGGATFAGYRIIRLLGSGGMGEVYLAEHPRLPRRDAVKILPAGLCADPSFRERFGREASIAATLFHPNIVGVHDRGECAGKLWISFDYVDGPDTAALMRSRYPAGMPHDEALEILGAVGAALDYAHERGLLHRDVKPANILLTDAPAEQRRILLADFGIARSLGEISGLTATNTALGTLLYAAPEQLTDAPIDARADQYSLAATAFHLFTGSPPDRHRAATVSALRPDLAALDEPIRTAMSTDPARRYPSCRHFVEALWARASGPGVSGPGVSGPGELGPDVPTRSAAVAPAPGVGSNTPAPLPSAPPPRRSPVGVVTAAVALGLLAGAVVLGTGREDHHTGPQAVQSGSTATVSITAAPITSTVSASPTTTTVTETVTASPAVTATPSSTAATPGAQATRPVPPKPALPSPVNRPTPDAGVITDAGWNACTRSYPWSACVDAARDAAGAPWAGAAPLTGDGTWAVPQSARFGDYRAAVGPMGRCQWYGYDVLGRVVDSGTFDLRGAPATATVTSTMTTFQTFGCTPWFRVAPPN